MYPVLHPDDCWFETLNDKQYFFFPFCYYNTTASIWEGVEGGEEYLLPSLICAIMFLFLWINSQLYFVEVLQESYWTGSEEGS